ncbi:MAG TPA: alternative ribosome rescue aminoacyl-tRNA hydrolase ArfB [Actinomycetes bacterium]|nr:alternative ribosome rescue aminoacyl-tRNA hydrolase ArfB [Actinomycetes bacterium]
MAEDDLVIRDSLVIPASELDWRFSRSSGPGGQSVNTSDSRASLRFNVEESRVLTDLQRKRINERLGDRLADGVLTVTASEERSQYLNRQQARRRLAALLAAAVAPPPRRRRATKPSRASIERRLTNKRRRSELKRNRGQRDD